MGTKTSILSSGDLDPRSLRTFSENLQSLTNRLALDLHTLGNNLGNEDFPPLRLAHKNGMFCVWVYNNPASDSDGPSLYLEYQISSQGSLELVYATKDKVPQ